jgi:accessory gene regulator protein AgrB
MLVVTVLTTLIHAFVIAKAVTFFRVNGPCRESDKTIVAMLGALSAMFILAQVLVTVDNFGRVLTTSLASALLMGFNFSNAFFYLAQIKVLTDRRSYNACQRYR